MATRTETEMKEMITEMSTGMKIMVGDAGYDKANY